MFQPNVLYICITVVLVTIIVAFSARSLRKEKQYDVFRDRIDALERDLGVLKIPILDMNVAFQGMLKEQLTHFHTPELDALLVKLGPPFTLTTEELERLIVLLSERTRDMGTEIDESEREAATMLPFVMRRVAQLKSADQKMELILVAVPKKPIGGK